MTTTDEVKLDLNNPEFQDNLFSLEKQQALAVLRSLKKMRQMTWPRIYSDSGLNWEAIVSRTGPNGARLYSFRISKSFRGIAYRDGAWLRVLTLHPDHDSAYS